MSEIVKSEYNALDEQGNYKTHYFKTSADQVVGLGRIKNTEYQVGNVVYVDSNLSVALKCTQAGTTSNAELNISTKNIGDTVTDGSVVWQVCNRTSDVTSVNGKTGDVVVDTLPVGTSIMYMGNTVPDGYLAENGAAISRTIYAKLFAAIGTKYGAGNGSTTFNLPNKNNGSFAEGSDTAGTVKSAGLPNITGSIIDERRSKSNYSATGAFSAVYAQINTSNASGWVAEHFGGWTTTLNASRSSSIYGNSNTVQPKSVTVKFCIKY